MYLFARKLSVHEHAMYVNGVFPVFCTRTRPHGLSALTMDHG
jgi:hypothetical protein